MAITEITKDKKYLVRIYFRDGMGNPRDRKRIVYGTRKDAVLAEAQLYNELAIGITSNMTFKKLFDAYHESKPNVKPETLRKERELFTKYLIQISNKKIEYITPFNLITLRNNIEASDGSITQKNKAIYLLKSIYKFGKRIFGINDIASDVEIIKPKVKEKFTYNTLTPEEFQEVIQYEKLEVFRLLYEIYFWAGLRRGEALALFKKDLLRTRELDVYNSINSYQEVGPPKNESSYRRVKIHDDLYNRLLPHAKSKGKFLLGGEKNIAPNTVNRRFSACLYKANVSRREIGLKEIPHVRIHDLRHSHATFLASQNIPITVVSARLGHSSISETMQTYVHLFKGDDIRALEAIDNYLNHASDTETINSTGNFKQDVLNLAKGMSFFEIEKELNNIITDLKQSITI
ncbi:site-specific integrase [Erysipelothrix rhusiopathiae]|nr:site-specific integrase [Erysipelothrix rhusiopathiae]MDE8203884.1 site-specific integrase [Erysipelothrix rhusiopathiae]MDE8258496.1 site-specific integrase [Erysipelothrix rhusiopathiae]MDE8272382.1 site-specific integrase [Erysipelothrix rhusiopathiae]MDE8301460.1 site-specific integrase [Erysipelothrix rhusiopathiae]